MTTCVASFIIREEPEAPPSIAPRRWWSLNLVVGGTFHQVGDRVVAYTEHEAAQAFARALAQGLPL